MVGRLLAFLRAAGAGDHPHAAGRRLLDHLVGTYEIVRRWDQPAWLQRAALMHSVYGTDVHRRALFPLSRRADLIDAAGVRAERIAYLFAVAPREPLLAGTYRWAPGALASRLPQSTHAEPPTQAELDALVLLHMANLAEQAQATDGSPGLWLYRLRGMAELLIDSESVTLPRFVAGLVGMSETDERAARGAYRDALSEGHTPEEEDGLLALAAARCPVLAEPCVWLAYRARCHDRDDLARGWAGTARHRLNAIGTAWDKRLPFDAWLEVASRLEQASPRDDRGRGQVAEPAELVERVVGRHVGTHGAPRPGGSDRPSVAAGRARFERYLDLLADPASSAVRGDYPDLETEPWYEASRFSLARGLEADFTEVRQELLALDSDRFRPEAERIPRQGHWDVVFFYERGRRHDDVLDACPVTARLIETADSMRTAAGLIYLSRMRPGTHIAAHRGPTNLRLRCHLGVSVPAGDCAIRVADETRQWTEGNCLVFCDYFEHEAWNHTGEDRIVLIVDLWHPALTPHEVERLTGLYRYGYEYGRRLNQYWIANARRQAGSATG